jgi:hypothetical protein
MKVFFVALFSFIGTYASAEKEEESSSVYACFDNLPQEGFGEKAGSPTTMHVHLHRTNHDHLLLDIDNVKVSTSTSMEDAFVVETSCDSNVCDVELSFEKSDTNFFSKAKLTGNATIQELSSLPDSKNYPNTTNIFFSLSLEDQSDLCTQQEQQGAEVDVTKVILVVLTLTIFLAICCYMATAKNEVVF